MDSTDASAAAQSITGAVPHGGTRRNAQWFDIKRDADHVDGNRFELVGRYPDGSAALGESTIPGQGTPDRRRWAEAEHIGILHGHLVERDLLSLVKAVTRAIEDGEPVPRNFLFRVDEDCPCQIFVDGTEMAWAA